MIDVVCFGGYLVGNDARGRTGKKTTNFDAMRDLNGRRIRHVKAVACRDCREGGCSMLQLEFVIHLASCNTLIGP